MLKVYPSSARSRAKLSVITDIDISGADYLRLIVSPVERLNVVFKLALIFPKKLVLIYFIPGDPIDHGSIEAILRQQSRFVRKVVPDFLSERRSNNFHFRAISHILK